MEFLNSILPGRTARAVWRASLVCLAAWSGAAVLRAADGPMSKAISPEYAYKAGLLSKLDQFVEWPARAFHDAQSPLVIGVLGDDPFDGYLDEVVRGEKIGERSIVVRRLRRGDDATECHILFISRSEAAQFDKIIPALAGRSILTVSDADGFERAGGMIRFAIEDNKVRLRINPDAAKAVELAISSKLLRLATLVTREKN